MNRTRLGLLLILTGCVASPHASPLPRHPESVITNCTTGCGSGSTATPAPTTDWPAATTEAGAINGDQFWNTTNAYDGTLVGFTYTPSGGFSNSNLVADFGTLVFSPSTGFPNKLPSLKPRTAACNSALGHLNAAFFTWYGATIGMIFTGAKFPPAWHFVKLNPQNGSVVALWTGSTLELNALQNDVDAACKGQGAGREPYG